jgi:hypothetical protein
VSDPNDEDPNQGFPVSPPVNVPWPQRRTEPIIGPEAERDIRTIRATDRRLAKRLVRSIGGLLDRPSSTTLHRIADPPGVGPRYATDLGDGYAAVCWVLTPPVDQSRNGQVIWIERVVRWGTLSGAIAAMAPDE